MARRGNRSGGRSLLVGKNTKSEKNGKVEMEMFEQAV